MSVSVLINTLNEEKNIRNCLESVKWADEIILVDMYSDDKTIDIAKEYTDNIFMHERMGYVEPARQFALEKATNNWVLVLDADELIPITLKEKLLKIKKENNYEIVSIPRKNYFFGEELVATGWAPLNDKQLRFFKKNKMNFSSRIHKFYEPEPNAQKLELNDEFFIIHFNYLGVEHFLNKLNRYTTIEAENAYDNDEKFSLKKLIFLPLKEFLIRFLYKKGYKDGIKGFVLSVFMAIYQLSLQMKLFLIERNKTKNIEKEIKKSYDNIALGVINEYEKK